MRTLLLLSLCCLGSAAAAARGDDVPPPMPEGRALTDRPGAVAFSPDGRLVAAAIRKDIKLWDLNTGELTHTLRGHGNWELSIAFSPDGKSLVSGGTDGVRLWTLAAER